MWGRVPSPVQSSKARKAPWAAGGSCQLLFDSNDAVLSLVPPPLHIIQKVNSPDPAVSAIQRNVIFLALKHAVPNSTQSKSRAIEFVACNSRCKGLREAEQRVWCSDKSAQHVKQQTISNPAPLTYRADRKGRSCRIPCCRFQAGVCARGLRDHRSGSGIPEGVQ